MDVLKYRSGFESGFILAKSQNRHSDLIQEIKRHMSVKTNEPFARGFLQGFNECLRRGKLQQRTEQLSKAMTSQSKNRGLGR